MFMHFLSRSTRHSNNICFQHLLSTSSANGDRVSSAQPRQPFLVWLLLLLIFAVAIGSGCIRRGGGGTPPDTGYPEPKQLPTKPVDPATLFTPFEYRKAVKLTQAEAKQIIKQLNPATQRLRSWSELHFAVGQSLAYASSRPASTIAIDHPGLQVSYGQLATSLSYLQSILPQLDKNPDKLATDFHWFRIGPDFSFTGYYEPTLQANRTKTRKYHYPLYKTPGNLRKGVPYHTRHAIDRKGVLSGKNLELAWVTSEVDAFFLHIQGSGRLLFPDGSVSHALYANKNNRSYVPLGRVMRDEGLLEPDNISMQSIRQVLSSLPEHKQKALMDTNPSYIFFREADQGPLGAMGRPLTPWVSTATDRSVLPHGTFACVVLPLPDKKGSMVLPHHALTLPQDTGGAIKGHRIDLFCGPGEDAEHTAGYLDTKGAVYVLIKK